MLCLAKLVTFVITFIITPGIHAQTCPNGWFGRNCTFMCQCALNARCDNAGTCPGGKCASNYFGPACQFYDYVSGNADPSTAAFLKDGNSATCNPVPTSTLIDVQLNSTYRFLWFRVEVNNEGHLLNFTIKVEGRNCINEAKFPGQHFVDVTCITNWTIQNLRITGSIVPDVCSIRISAGRNAALKQYARQSSTYSTSVASNAVDGNRFGTCSITAMNDIGKPWWRVSFQTPQLLFHITVQNKNDNQIRLLGFTLNGFDSVNNTVFTFVDVNPNTQFEYNIDWTSQATVFDIQITAKNWNSPFFTMCEVIAFGENVCPEGMFGLWCSETCQCKVRELCNSLTGLCGPVCQSGFFGEYCLSTCRSTCLDGLCMRSGGKCIECTTGYFGDFCDKDCIPGFFGEGCASKCLKNCAHVCHHVTGNCSCIDGFAGPTCSDCAPGIYGEKCTENCSPFCVDQKCNNISGDCFSCQQGRSGKFCEDCAPGIYGENCTENCSPFCVDQKCNKISGDCFSCQQGRSGKFCEACDTKVYGKKCAEKCSQFCVDKKCNNISGDCFSCQEGRSGALCKDCAGGYSGENCILAAIPLSEKSPDSSYGQYFVFLLVLAGLTVAVCVAMFLWVKKEPAATKEEGDRL